eukprot:1156888-Pelagomonas_calceolata.AAC.7
MDHHSDHRVATIVKVVSGVTVVTIVGVCHSDHMLLGDLKAVTVSGLPITCTHFSSTSQAANTLKGSKLAGAVQELWLMAIKTM